MRNKSTNNFTIILYVLLVTGIAVVLTAPHALAAQKTTGSSDPQAITPLIIPTNMALTWKGSFTLGENQALTRPRMSLSTAILLSLTGSSINNIPRNQVFSYNPGAIYQWITDQTKSYNVSPHEPVMNIENGRVTAFEPPQTGEIVDAYATMEQALTNLEKGDYKVIPVVNVSQPRTALSELNDLGINELISQGQSVFPNSPSNRRHNIKIGVQKMAGVIVKPGQEFSFNKYLGPVEAYTGFLPELVIKGDEGTVPEFGGGLCQVSSTAFRAAMHAGLPITERRNHSYAVSYYAPQGTDATIYPGVVDLKFVNDTPGSILIWPYFPNENTLVFDFYGTRDDRQVILKDPVQFDRQSNGALKASWTRTIIKNGVSESKTFLSNYQPPALFHKQEQFASNPQSPTPTQSVTTSPPPTNSPTPTPDQSSTGSPATSEPKPTPFTQ